MSIFWQRPKAGESASVLQSGAEARGKSQAANCAWRQGRSADKRGRKTSAKRPSRKRAAAQSVSRKSNWSEAR